MTHGLRATGLKAGCFSPADSQSVGSVWGLRGCVSVFDIHMLTGEV